MSSPAPAHSTSLSSVSLSLVPSAVTALLRTARLTSTPASNPAAGEAPPPTVPAQSTFTSEISIRVIVVSSALSVIPRTAASASFLQNAFLRDAASVAANIRPTAGKGSQWTRGAAEKLRVTDGVHVIMGGISPSGAFEPAASKGTESLWAAISCLSVSGPTALIRALLSHDGHQSPGISLTQRKTQVVAGRNAPGRAMPAQGKPAAARPTMESVQFRHVFYAALQKSEDEACFVLPLSIEDTAALTAARAGLPLAALASGLTLGPNAPSPPTSRGDIAGVIQKAMGEGAGLPPVVLGFPSHPSPRATGGEPLERSHMTVTILGRNDGTWSLDALNEKLRGVGLLVATPTSHLAAGHLPESLIPGGLTAIHGSCHSIQVRVSGISHELAPVMLEALRGSVASGLDVADARSREASDAPPTPAERLWDALFRSTPVQAFARGEDSACLSFSRLTGTRGPGAVSDWVATLSASDPSILTAILAHSLEPLAVNMDAVNDSLRVGLGQAYEVLLPGEVTTLVTFTPEERASATRHISNICHLCGMCQSSHIEAGVNKTTTLPQLAAALELAQLRAAEILGDDYASRPLIEVPQAVLSRATQDSVTHSAFATIATLRSLLEYRRSHTADDATAQKWRPPISPLVAAGLAKPLDRHVCLYQPTQTPSLIPAVGGCNRCGHLGHVGPLCRADTSSTAHWLLAQVLPPPLARGVPTLTSSGGPSGRQRGIAAEKLRELLTAASLAPAPQPPPSPNQAPPNQQRSPPASPAPPPELVALQSELERERSVTAQLQAQLSLRDAAAAAAPDLQAQILSAAASADRANLESRLSQQQSQIDSLARDLAQERLLREQSRAASEEMQQRTTSLAAQLLASQQSVLALEQREAQRQAATAAAAVTVGGAPESMGQREYDALLRKIEEATACARKAEAEAAQLKIAADSASATLLTDRANTAMTIKRLKAQLATAQKEREAALTRSDSGVASGDKRRLVAAPAPPPDGYVFSRHLPGRLMCMSAPVTAANGGLFSYGVINAKVTKALDGHQALKAALSGTGKASPRRKANLLTAVATSMMQLPELELDALLAGSESGFLGASLTLLQKATLPPAPPAKPASAAVPRGTSKAPPRSPRHPGFPQMSDGDDSDGSSDVEGAAGTEHPLAPPAVAGAAGGSQ